MLTSARATAVLSTHGKTDGTWITRWATEVSGERIETMNYSPYLRKVDMPQNDGRGHLVKLWERLDEHIELIKFVMGGGKDPEDVNLTKARATELSVVIAQLMSPFYSDSIAVLQEAQARWSARVEGREHESPGLAESIWDPNTRFDGTPYSRDAVAKVRNGGALSKKTVVFDDTKINFIRHCLETGSQTPEVLAGMFGCTVDDIKAAVE